MPFPAPGIFTAIVAAAQVARWIYQHAYNAAIPHNQDYAELVSAVCGFSLALENIQVIHTAAINGGLHLQVQQHLIPIEHSLESFKTIIGDFQSTLEECRNLLKANESYARGGRAFPARIVWGLTTVEKIKNLRSRIEFHHIRVSQMLQPLMISLILTLHTTTEDGLQGIGQDLSRIMEALGLQPILPVPVSLPSIPECLRGRFICQAGHDPPVSTEVRISSVMGHLNDTSSNNDIPVDANRDTAIQRYVHLMKAVWILQNLKDEIVDTADASSSLTTAIWNDLCANVVTQLASFDTTHAIPSDVEINNCPNTVFTLWIFPPVLIPVESVTIGLSEMVVLNVPLEVSLETGDATESQQLVVVRSITQPKSMRIVTQSSGRSQVTNIHNINIRTTMLLPTYAQPGAQFPTVQLRASANDELAMTFQFRSLTDLYQFQQSLTDYKVQYDQAGIIGIRYKHSGFRVLRRMEQLCDHRDTARAQIWYHSPPVVRGQDGLHPSTAPAPGDNPSQQVVTNPTSRRASRVSSGRSMSIHDWTRTNTPSSVLVSVNSSTSIGSSETITSEIVDLEEPKVVIMMATVNLSDTQPGGPRQTKSLLLFSFPLREGVYVDKSGRDDLSCTNLVIKSRAPLDARLYDYRHDLIGCNLVVLGQLQHTDVDKHCRKLDDLDRVIITFGDPGRRRSFEDALDDTRDLYEQRRLEREKFIRNVQTSDVVR